MVTTKQHKIHIYPNINKLPDFLFLSSDNPQPREGFGEP